MVNFLNIVKGGDADDPVSEFLVYMNVGPQNTVVLLFTKCGQF